MIIIIDEGLTKMGECSQDLLEGEGEQEERTMKTMITVVQPYNLFNPNQLLDRDRSPQISLVSFNWHEPSINLQGAEGGHCHIRTYLSSIQHKDSTPISLLLIHLKRP